MWNYLHWDLYRWLVVRMKDAKSDATANMPIINALVYSIEWYAFKKYLKTVCLCLKQGMSLMIG